MTTVLTEIINAGLNTFLFYLFFKIFWAKEDSPYIRIGSYVLSFVLLIITMLFLKGTIFTSILLFVSSVILCFAFSSKILHKIIYTLIIVVLSFATEMVTGVGFAALFSVSIDVVKNGVLYIPGMLTSKLVLFIAVFVIKLFKHKPLPVTKNKRQLWLIVFPVASTIVLIIQHALLLNYPKDNFMHYLVLFSDFALLGSNMIIFDYIDSIYENTIVESKILHANKLIEIQAQQYRNLMESNYKLSKTKHDFKNFCIGIISELESGETKRVINKLNGIYEDIAPIQTGARNVFDTLMHIKSEEARKKGISVSYKGCHLPKLRFNDVDLSILLGNAIDNAIEATEKVGGDRTISVLITFNNDMVVIKIKNPVIKNVDVTNLNTTKSNASNHGFGIISMKQIVNKYSGELIFTCKDLLFVTSIVMNNLPSRLPNRQLD